MTTTVMDMVNTAKQEISEINVEQANALLAGGSLALDVRERIEFDAGHIPGARHISRGMLEFLIGNHPDFEDRQQSIVVYCKSGGRSALAAQTLQHLGYTDVHSMKGGFDAWNAGSDIPAATTA